MLSGADVAAAAPMPNSPAVIGSNQAGLTQVVTVPQGSSLTVRMIDSVDSSVNKPGDVFHASLEDALAVGDVVVAKKDADRRCGRDRGDDGHQGRASEGAKRNATPIPALSAGYDHAAKVFFVTVLTVWYRYRHPIFP